MLDVFQDVGRDMFLSGLVGSHAGTLSVRQEEGTSVTRRGARLGKLSAEDLIAFDLNDEPPADAAEDAAVHVAIYRATDAQAVIYARPPYTMALALSEDRLSPANGEGGDYFGSAPVLISQRALNSPDVAHLVSRTLRENRVVALRGQGVFARGADLADAFRVVSLLEEMCQVACISRSLVAEESQPMGREWNERPPTGLSPFRNKNGGGRGGGAGGGMPRPPRGGVPTRRPDGPPPQPRHRPDENRGPMPPAPRRGRTPDRRP